MGFFEEFLIAFILRDDFSWALVSFSNLRRSKKQFLCDLVPLEQIYLFDWCFSLTIYESLSEVMESLSEVIESLSEVMEAPIAGYF